MHAGFKAFDETVILIILCVSTYSIIIIYHFHTASNNY